MALVPPVKVRLQHDLRYFLVELAMVAPAEGDEKAKMIELKFTPVRSTRLPSACDFKKKRRCAETGVREKDSV